MMLMSSLDKVSFIQHFVVRFVLLLRCQLSSVCVVTSCFVVRLSPGFIGSAPFGLFSFRRFVGHVVSGCPGASLRPHGGLCRCLPVCLPARRLDGNGIARIIRSPAYCTNVGEPCCSSVPSNPMLPEQPLIASCCLAALVLPKPCGRMLIHLSVSRSCCQSGVPAPRACSM